MENKATRYDVKGGIDPYADYKDEEAPSDKLEMLAALADAWEDATEEVERCAEALTRAQARVREIEEQQIPEVMDELELETFTTRSGRKVEVQEKIRCSIPKVLQAKAFDWLRENGHGRLLKRKLSLAFGMGEDADAENFKRRIIDMGFDEFDDREEVHNSTLVAFVREKIELGEELPSDLFPVFRHRVAKVK